MHSPSSSATQNSSSSNDETSTLITSYRDMREADILAEIKKFEENGIHYLGNENIASLYNFVYDKDVKGEVLVPKDNSNDISESVFSGVFEIDARNFFMTSDGKWNSKNPLGTRFDQIKPSCRLLAPRRDNSLFIFNNDFPKIIANIQAIENFGNSRTFRDTHSIVLEETGQPTQIRLSHHLFSVCFFIYLSKI